MKKKKIEIGSKLIAVNLSENENDYIIGSGISTSGEGDYYWTIPHYTMVTLVKIDNGRWMLAGPGIRTGW